MSLPAIHRHPLPFVDALERRAPAQIDTVVIHCTELPDLATARAFGERVLYPSGTGNSGHYYIDRDGRIEEYVPPERIAHHVHGWNARSIGIELVNTGRYPDWLDSRHQAMDEAYPDAQIDALITLLHWLCDEVPTLVQIVGHEDLDREQVPASDDPAVSVCRKRDPGPRFPWGKVLATISLGRIGADDFTDPVQD